MLIGSSLWAYIIGCGCSVVATLTPAAEEHRRLVSMLNYFCRDAKVPKDLSNRLRLYLNDTSQLRYREINRAELMSTMTVQLRREISGSAARTLFMSVPWLSHPEIEPEFLSIASLKMTTSVYCPREPVPTIHLGVVIRGLVSRSGRIGVACLGADMLLNEVALRDLDPAMALTLVQLTSL